MKQYSNFNEMFTANSNTSYSVFNFDGKEEFLDKCVDVMVNDYLTFYSWLKDYQYKKYYDMPTTSSLEQMEDKHFKNNKCILRLIDEECADEDNCWNIMLTLSDYKPLALDGVLEQPSGDDLQETAKNLLLKLVDENAEMLLEKRDNAIFDIFNKK